MQKKRKLTANVEYKTIKLILNKIEVKPIRTRKQISKKEKKIFNV